MTTQVTTGVIADSAVTPAKLSQPLTQGTAQATTSGTTKDFTSIPSWAKRITVVFNNVSTNGSGNLLIQLGTSGGFVSTGYTAVVTNQGGGTVTNSTSGFIVTNNGGASETFSGIVTIALVGSNAWVSSGQLRPSTGLRMSAGDVTLAAALTQLRITTTTADTFDLGSVNIFYEG